MKSLWATLSARWLRAYRPVPAPPSAPRLSVADLSPALRRDLNLGDSLPGEDDFSLRPSIRTRMISPFAGF